MKKGRKVPTRELPTHEAINVIKKELAQKRVMRSPAAADLQSDAEGLGLGDRLIARVRSFGPIPFAEFMAVVNGSRPSGFRRHMADMSKYRKKDWMDLPFLRRAYGLAVAGYFHRAWLEFDPDLARRLREAQVQKPATMIECLQGAQAEWAQLMLSHVPSEAPPQTRLVISNPEEGALVSEIILAMAMAPPFANTLQQVVLVERRGLRQQAQARMLKVAIERALGKTVVPVTPNATVPALKPGAVQLRWVKSLREIPQTPGLWTMLLSHDYLGSLPAHMVQRSHDGYTNVHLTYGSGATSFRDAATEDAGRERLMLSPLGAPQELAWPTGMYDPRMYSVSLGSRAVIQTGVFDAGRRMAHIISGRSNISPQADAPGRPSHAVGANEYGLYAHRPRHSAMQEVAQGSQIDLRDGARDSWGGLGLVLDPMTPDVKAISKGLCAVKPGKAGYSDMFQAVGSADLVAPVDLAAFEAGVNAVARTATHPWDLRSFWAFEGLPDLIRYWIDQKKADGVELTKEQLDQLVVTWRQLVSMRFRKVPYQAVGIEAPPFRVEQYLSALNGYSPVPTEVEPLEGEGTRAEIAARANEFSIRAPPFDRPDPRAARRTNRQPVYLAVGLGGAGILMYSGYTVFAKSRSAFRARSQPAQTSAHA